jgi:hypothetical protein
MRVNTVIFYLMFYLVKDGQNFDFGLVTNWTIKSHLFKKKMLCGVVALDKRTEECDLCNYDPYQNP